MYYASSCLGNCESCRSLADAGNARATSSSSPSAPLSDFSNFSKKVSKLLLAAALEKIAKLYPSAPTMPHGYDMSAPPAEEKPSESSTKALETAQKKLAKKFERVNNIAPSSKTVDAALERLHNKFQRSKNKVRNPEEQLNEAQKGM